jgi:hypothetical protein
MRQRQHLLSQRTLGQRLVVQRRCRLGLAVLAAHAQEPLLHAPALQIGIKLLLHLVGQRSPFPRSQLAKYRIVLLDEPIQQRGVGPLPRVA